MRPTRRREPHEPCLCVLRSIFRACLRRLQMVESLPRGAPRRWGSGWVRPQEEFAADFCLLAARTLRADELRLLKLHLVGHMGWKKCAPLLGLDRGQFFHSVYRVEAKMGRALRETRPYGLWPLQDYFASRKV